MSISLAQQLVASEEWGYDVVYLPEVKHHTYTQNSLRCTPCPEQTGLRQHRKRLLRGRKKEKLRRRRVWYLTFDTNWSLLVHAVTRRMDVVVKRTSFHDSHLHWTLGIAQLVQCPTEMPGASLTQVQVPGRARDFSLPESTFCADSLTVSIQAPCAVTCINICAHVKNLKHLQPYNCLDTEKYCKCW